MTKLTDRIASPGEPVPSHRVVSVETSESLTRFAARVSGWARGVSLARKLGIGLFVAAAISGVATYGVLTGSTPFGPEPDTVLVLVNINLVLGLLIGALVARRVVQLWVERRRGSAGSRLHVRLVMLFGLLAATPAIVVAVFSVLFLNFGIQSWFSERVSTALKASLAVAAAYLDEHHNAVRADVLAMSNDLERESSIIFREPTLLQQVFNLHAAVRGLPEAILFDGSGRVLARSGLSFALEFDPVPNWAIDKARQGEVAIMTNEARDRVRALVRLDNLVDTYLYAGRFVAPVVLNHVRSTRDAVQEYERLEGKRSGIQINFAMMFAVLSGLLLLAAVWVGLMVARHLAGPISGLAAAAEQVRAGDLTVRVREANTGDELGSLMRAFNRMTSQLETQRAELVDANLQLDTRRRFTEAVLAGVSAGVIGLDHEGRINLPNRSASALLSVNLDAMIGRELSDAVPEMAELMAEARRMPQRLVESQIKIARRGRVQNLLVRIAAERSAGELKGMVVTFDDVTDLLAAQRGAAWADVARRIAHEIKNPLTPIQLSAERLKRKYLSEIKSDPETFKVCTDTIVRQVGDIGRMVDEFSAFARMPAPVIRPEDLVEVVRQTITLQRAANPTIEYEIDLPEEPIRISCDRRQIGQALTNLLQNAADSVFEARPSGDGKRGAGHILVRARTVEGKVVLDVEDNGAGFPHELRERLTEPYVTTRAKGTGLGLAIVKKIMEDHGAQLLLEDRDGGGARVRLVFRPGATVAAPDHDGQIVRTGAAANV